MNDISILHREFIRKQKSGKGQKTTGGSDDEEEGASSDDENYLNPDLDEDDSDDIAQYDYSDDDDDDDGRDADGFKMEGAEEFDEEGFGASDSDDSGKYSIHFVQ